MFFNGKPYGDHVSPHARTLPWEEKHRQRGARAAAEQLVAAAGSPGRPYPARTAPAAPVSRTGMTPGSSYIGQQLSGFYSSPAAQPYHARLGAQLGVQSRIMADVARLEGRENPLAGGAWTGTGNHAALEHHEHLTASDPRPLTLDAKRKYHRKASTRNHVVISSNAVTVKTRLRAAAYTAGGVDYDKLFRFYDRDNSGTICVNEFMSLVRKDGKVTRTMMTDDQLLDVYIKDVDADGDGNISKEELVAWITSEGTRTGRRAERAAAAAPAAAGVGTPALVTPGGGGGGGGNGGIAEEFKPASPRKAKTKIGQLTVGIGRRPGSNLPMKRIAIVIRDGDQPGTVVNNLRRKHKLLKGQAEHIAAEIREIIAQRREGHEVHSDMATQISPRRSRRKSAVGVPSSAAAPSNSERKRSGSPTMAFGRRMSISGRTGYQAPALAHATQYDDCDDAGADANDRAASPWSEDEMMAQNDKVAALLGSPGPQSPVPQSPVPQRPMAGVPLASPSAFAPASSDPAAAETTETTQEAGAADTTKLAAALAASRAAAAALEGALQESQGEALRLRAALAGAEAENEGLKAEVAGLRKALRAIGQQT